MKKTRMALCEAFDSINKIPVPDPYDRRKNPEGRGVLIDSESFKLHILRRTSIASGVIKDTFTGASVGVAVGATGMVATSTSYSVLGVPILVGGATLGAACLTGGLVGLAVAGTMAAHRYLRRKRIKIVQMDWWNANVDNIARFVSATVFLRFTMDHSDQEALSRFQRWGYDETWAQQAVTILRKVKIDVKELADFCSSVDDLNAVLLEFGLPADTIPMEVFKDLIEDAEC